MSDDLKRAEAALEEEFTQQTFGAPIRVCHANLQSAQPQPTIPEEKIPQTRPKLPANLPPAANDPNIKPPFKWGKFAGRMGGFIGGMLVPGNAAEDEWHEDGIDYRYTYEDAHLTATHPDGAVEHFTVSPSGGVILQDGSVVGFRDKDGKIYGQDDPKTEDAAEQWRKENERIQKLNQEHNDYDTWIRNGGHGTFDEWKAAGMPISPNRVSSSQEKQVNSDKGTRFFSPRFDGVEEKFSELSNHELKKLAKTGDIEATFAHNMREARTAFDKGDINSAFGNIVENMEIDRLGTKVLKAGEDVKFPSPGSPNRSLKSDIDIETHNEIIEIKSGSNNPSSRQIQTILEKARQAEKTPVFVINSNTPNLDSKVSGLEANIARNRKSLIDSSGLQYPDFEIRSSEHMPKNKEETIRKALRL